MKDDYPILKTNRLVLRKFLFKEACIVRKLAGSKEVSHGCINIPHPYGLDLAEVWIASHEIWHSEGSQLVFAVTRIEDGWIIGAVALVLEPEHTRADLGYWIGFPFWNQGYATEAVRAVITYAFDDLHLHRITASHFVRNLASGRVLEKLGMKKEGLLREYLLQDGVREDVIIRGLLKSDVRPFSEEKSTNVSGERT